MEGEAFSHAAIATYLNEHFLPIKVDREERPDIDSIYMQALQAMTGQGGWPMNLFISPEDGIPFYGGTYFPVEAKYGRAGFLQVLQSVRNFYDTEKQKLADQSQNLFNFLAKSAQLTDGNHLDGDYLNAELLTQGMKTASAILERQTPGPNFPMMPYALLALQSARLDESALAIAQQRGMDLVLGGIYDHVGGGFHRYTVDATWTVPHFEKMLYDNGQILEYLANLWSAGIQDAAIERAITGTVSWLQREMIADLGYFYAAQDADNFAHGEDPEPEEGEFYVWTFAQLQALLSPDELTALQATFEIHEHGNFEGASVLQRRGGGELPQALEPALEKLFRVRYGKNASETAPFPPAHNNDEAKSRSWPGRIPPVTDTKMIVAWNSLMISGLARAAIVMKSPLFFDLAESAANFITQHQWHNEQLYRLNYEGQIAVLSQSEDYAFLIKAYLDLHQASLCFKPDLAPDFLAQALRTQSVFESQLGPGGQGYFNTPTTIDSTLDIRERSWQDNATPSANGIAIANLVRLSMLTEDLAYLDQAEQALKTFGAVMSENIQLCPSLFAAFDWFLNHAYVKTKPDQIQTLLRSGYWPTLMAVSTHNLDDNTFARVCQGQACQAPATDLAMCLEQVNTVTTKR